MPYRGDTAINWHLGFYDRVGVSGRCVSSTTSGDFCGQVWPIATYKSPGDSGVELALNYGILTLIDGCLYVVDTTGKHPTFPLPNSSLPMGERSSFRSWQGLPSRG